MKRLILMLTLVMFVMTFLQLTSANKTAVATTDPIQGSRCFDVDPGIGNPSRDDHYRWAQQFDSQKLMNNLVWKIGIIFNCRDASGDQLARGFGAMSAIVANYVSNPACFNNDSGVVERNAAAHEQWARTKTREQVRDNLQWKAASAMRCLNRDYQLAFFADQSAALARIPGVSSGGRPDGGTAIGWGDNPAGQGRRGANGQRFSYSCPGGGTASSVWGTDIYTDDSSICTAAVHAGLINFQSGGTVTIEIRAGQQSYPASARYGVTSREYAAWPGSFVFVR